MDKDGPRSDCLTFDGNWNYIAELLIPRNGHRSVVYGNEIIHIGGRNTGDAM